MPNHLNPTLERAYREDRLRLEKTALPIVTLSGTFQEDLQASAHGHASHAFHTAHPDLQKHLSHDIVFSRAHFSMAVGVATQAWGKNITPTKAWVVDPTNYVAPRQWHSIQLSEELGKSAARHSFLKYIKELFDQFGRNKLPILSSVTPPLLYLTENVHRPILSFHIAAGNVLAQHGKTVVQVITDPHVRPEYVVNATLPNIRYCVFDERTRLEFLELAAIHHVAVDPNKVVVTGPPIDPRVIQARQHKAAWRSGPLRLCITTGGLGTNKAEIRQLLTQLLPELRRQSKPYQLVVYTGTQQDIAQMVTELAARERIHLGSPEDHTAPLRFLYHPHLFEANELLIKYGFPWAHGFITKPSGDMAYDAVASGSFLLTLKEWGVWEERIREIFEQKDIARRAETEHICDQLAVLQAATRGSQSWIERAMNHAFGIEKLFLLGSEKIIKIVTSTSSP